MYCTLHIKLNGKIPKGILKKLDSAGSHKFNTGQENISYRYKNLSISINDFGYSIKGSLAKYHFGSNFYTLDIQETKKAIEKLSDELEINISEGKLTRIDIGTNLIMKENIDNYLHLFGSLSQFTPFFQDKTIYYNNYRKQLIFYDKLKEVKKHKIPIPEYFLKFKNRILRYEFRFTNRLPEQFNMESVKVNNLYDERFYKKCLDMWKNDYFSIFKENKLKFKVCALKNAKLFQEQLMILGIKSIGFNNAFEILKLSKVNLTSNQYYRRLKQIKRLAKHEILTDPHDSILELNNKIELVVANQI